MPATDVYLGVVLELNDQEIALEPSTAITKAKTEGMDMALPSRVELGTVGNSLRSIFESLGMEPSTLDAFMDDAGNIKQDELPDIQALRNMINLITMAYLSVEKFHVFMPPTMELNPNKTLVATTPLVQIPPLVDAAGNKHPSLTVNPTTQKFIVPATIPPGAIRNPKLETLYTIGLSATWKAYTLSVLKLATKDDLPSTGKGLVAVGKADDDKYYTTIFNADGLKIADKLEITGTANGGTSNEIVSTVITIELDKIIKDDSPSNVELNLPGVIEEGTMDDLVDNITKFANQPVPGALFGGLKLRGVYFKATNENG
jgi:hypothetical protein